jgi:hypothetical protein
VGGLLVSQVLTLFTTPVIYLLFDRWQLKLRSWWASHAPLEPSDDGKGLRESP